MFPPLTDTIEKFILKENLPHIVYISTSSANYVGHIMSKDMPHKRIEMTECSCDTGTNQISLDRVIINIDAIISWGIPS